MRARKLLFLAVSHGGAKPLNTLKSAFSPLTIKTTAFFSHQTCTTDLHMATYNILNITSLRIKVLEVGAGSKKTSIYIGLPRHKGLHHLVKEILDNSVDEAISVLQKPVQLFAQAQRFAPTIVIDTKNNHVNKLRTKIGDQIITEMITVGYPDDLHESGVPPWSISNDANFMLK
jgi:hypothetical protein